MLRYYWLLLLQAAYLLISCLNILHPLDIFHIFCVVSIKVIIARVSFSI